MKSFADEWLQSLKVSAVPAFLFVCCDFLYRLSEINVLRDAVLSFAFVELGLMVLASVVALLLALMRRFFPRPRYQEILIGVLIAYSSISIFLMYLKWWLFSFTDADERGYLIIRYYYVFIASFFLTAGGVFLWAKRPALRDLLKEAQRRCAFLALAVSACSLFVLLGYGLLRHRIGSAAEYARRDADSSGRPNVFLLVVDSLAAHALSSYGYGNDTPFFGRWAKEAYFFTNARANVTMTGASISSLLTGRSPMKSHILGDYQVPSEAAEWNVLTLFEKAGYRTESLSQTNYASPYFLGFPSFTEGETRLFDGDLSNGLNRLLTKLCRKMGFSLKFKFHFAYEPVTRFPKAFDVISRRILRLREGESPFFLYAHIYLPFYVSYDFSDTLGTDINSFRFQKAHYCGFYPPEMQRTVGLARKAYDRTVSDLDREMGRFMDSLKEKGVLDNTIVVVTADHGDTFEKGYWGHGNDLSENSIKVPLYIVMPSQEGKVVDHPVQLCDIAPTILNLNRMEIPDWMDCYSALPTLEDAPKRRTAVTFNFPVEESVRARPRFPGLSAGRSIALYDSGYKYILHPRGRPSELYDLKSDPFENNNLAFQIPDRSKALHAKLLDLLGVESP